MKRTIYRFLLPVFLGTTTYSIHAKSTDTKVDTDSIRTFTLGEVSVWGELKKTMGTELTGQELQQLGRYRVTEALDLLPGITLTRSGDRNEGMIFLRGFDQRQIPVFMDGIPVYIPYDGSLDLNRLQTAPLERIQLSKGMSSLLLGGNTMGGAINLVSRRPLHTFEADAEVNTLWNTLLNMGSRWKKGYAQIGGSMLLRGDFRLPASFKPVEGVEEGRHRKHSATHDYLFHAKIGFTPTRRQEYAVGYSLIRADKDIPVYLGENGRKKYWRYKQWDKDQLFFHSRTAFTHEWVLETRAFYDKYRNELAAYDDATYTTQTAPSSFTSFYDDYAVGGNLTVSWMLSPTNTLKGGLNGKQDVHRSHNEGEPIGRQSEYRLSAAMEDTWMLGDKLTFLAGAGYFFHKGTKAENYERLPDSKAYGLVDYPLSSDHDWNFEAAVNYRPAAGQSFRFSFARHSRFASLKERYSYKMGKAWPNPDLKTEHAYNLDLCYEGRWQWFSWMLDGYYIFITDIIQEITGVDPEDAEIWQLQNRGRAHFRGLESEWHVRTPRLNAGMNYTLTAPVNRTDKGVKFVYVPRHKVNVFLQVKPLWKIQFRADMNYNSPRYSSSDGKTSVPGFTVFHISVERQFLPGLNLRAGVYNLFDKLYVFKEGYPEPGRLWYAAVRYHFTCQP